MTISEKEIIMLTDIRNEFLADILITAVEGGINYWAIVRDYTLTSVSIQDRLDEDSDWRKITLETINDAIMTIVNSNPNKSFMKMVPGGIKYLSPGIHRNIVHASEVNDAGYLDASYADVIIQVALFNEVRYG